MHGAHERIFNSMLNGSLTLTNESSFVSEMNRTELNSINYLNPEELADKVDFYNENPKNREEIALNARDFALENHTWSHRADQILKETKEHG
jgi:spore maturation protein CgeB